MLSLISFKKSFMHAHVYFFNIFFYNPRNEVKVVYWNHPDRPSVRPSSVDAWLGKMVSCA